jgi:hypothetical protein
MSNDNAGGGRRQSTYTNSEINSYDRDFSSMSFTFAEGRGLISLSPIFEEYIGKQPKRGDNVFDHDSKLNFSVDAQAAVRIKRGIQALLNDAEQDEPEITNVCLRFGNDKQARSLTIFRPNGVKLSGQNFDNYLLRLTTTKDGSEEKMYHVLQNSVVAYKVGKEEVEEVVETDLMLLLEFCDRVIDNSFMVMRHGAKLAGGVRAGGSGGSKGAGRRAVEEEDGDGESEGKSEKPRAGAKASMEAEFEE